MSNIIKRTSKHGGLAKQRPRPAEVPPPTDIAPHLPTEVVSKAELREAEQMKEKPPPRTLFRKPPVKDEPAVRGAVVKAEALMGFLDAIMVLGHRPYEEPLVTVEIVPEDEKVFLEHQHTQARLIIQMDARPKVKEIAKGAFSPHRAIGVIRLLAAEEESIEIGVDGDAVGFGKYRITLDEEFTPIPPPVLKPAKTRIAMPSSYPEELVMRVPWPVRVGLHDHAGAIVVTFEWEKDEDGVGRYAAVANVEGDRSACRWKMPGALVETLENFIGDSPEPILIPLHFFQCLAHLAEGNWVGLEVSDDQIYARGVDYGLMVPIGKLAVEDVYNATYNQMQRPNATWMVQRAKLEKAVKGIPFAGLADLTAEGTLLSVSSHDDWLRSTERIEANPMGPSQKVTASIAAHELESAARSCRGTVVHLGFCKDGVRLVDEDGLWEAQIGAWNEVSGL